VVLLGCASGEAPLNPSVSADSTGLRFAVHTAANRHRISPYIYGANQFDWKGRRKALKLGRLGGNRFTAYNWETNASNAGSDYNHQNDDHLGGGDTPGEAVREHVAAAQQAGAAMVVTVPIAGFVAADKEKGGDVNQAPDFLHRRFLESRARKDGPYQFPPDRKDRAVYQDEFVAWLEAAFPEARHDPARTIFYSLDNEPDLWTQTHPRLRPNGKVTYAEILERTKAFASGVKHAAPKALVFGPVSYGWTGFGSLQDAADRRGRDFLEFYLDSLREAEAQAGLRLVDVLDLHWYSEARGGGVRVIEQNDSDAVADARIQAPRSLWDPSYVETSWISQDARAGAIRLIPRMKEKIAAHYRGTRLAITEYGYGGGDHISGALAQADVLGIFGREDVFAAALWDLPGGTRFLDAAFAAFTDYDGKGGRFGDTSVSATTSDNAASSVYASIDEGRAGRVVLVAINKTRTAQPAELRVDHPVALTRAQSWQLTAAAPALQKGPAVQSSGGNTFRLELPASSVVTIALEGSQP
jgi:hypothetical protein